MPTRTRRVYGLVLALFFIRVNEFFVLFTFLRRAFAIATSFCGGLGGFSNVLPANGG